MKPEEIEIRTKELDEKFKNNTISKEEIVEREELSLRGFINSCIIYRMEYYIIDSNGEVRKNNLHFNKKRYTTLNGEVIISDERIKELLYEQKKTFEKATIIQNVYTDHEGVSYNSVVWS